MSVSTATLADPTQLKAAKGACRIFQAKTLTVVLTWTPTTSPRATGYVVLRNGTQVATVSGAGSTGWTDATGALAFSTTYSYEVQATVGNWTSGGTSVSFKTPAWTCR
jgi:hypothetical protein